MEEKEWKWLYMQAMEVYLEDNGRRKQEIQSAGEVGKATGSLQEVWNSRVPMEANIRI